MVSKESVLAEYKRTVYSRSVLAEMHGEDSEFVMKADKRIKELEALAIIVEVELPSPKY